MERAEMSESPHQFQENRSTGSNQPHRTLFVSRLDPKMENPNSTSPSFSDVCTFQTANQTFTTDMQAAIAASVARRMNRHTSNTPPTHYLCTLGDYSTSTSEWLVSKLPIAPQPILGSDSKSGTSSFSNTLNFPPALSDSSLIQQDPSSGPSDQIRVKKFNKIFGILMIVMDEHHHPIRFCVMTGTEIVSENVTGENWKRLLIRAVSLLNITHLRVIGFHTYQRLKSFFPSKIKLSVERLRQRKYRCGGCLEMDCCIDTCLMALKRLYVKNLKEDAVPRHSPMRGRMNKKKNQSPQDE